MNGARVAQARLALLLLTRLPAGRLRDPAPAIGASVWAFPLVGLVVGALAAAVLTLALALELPAPIAAGLALMAQIAATGALHEDGLADLADGLWGGRDRARRLEIMRDSRIGSYGALALILSVGLRWQALAAITTQGGAAHAALALMVLATTSRAAPAVLMAKMPPARSDGMGHEARAAPVRGAALAVALGAATALLLPATALPLLMVQALLVTSLAWLAQRRLGGQTGDVLGAAQQIAEIGGALVLSAALTS